MTTHMLRLQLISQDGQVEKTELIEHARNCGLKAVYDILLEQDQSFQLDFQHLWINSYFVHLYILKLLYTLYNKTETKQNVASSKERRKRTINYCSSRRW